MKNAVLRVAIRNRMRDASDRGFVRGLTSPGTVVFGPGWYSTDDVLIIRGYRADVSAMRGDWAKVGNDFGIVVKRAEAERTAGKR